MTTVRKLDIRNLEVAKPHGWIKHLGGRCPVNPNTQVMIRYRTGLIVGPVEAKSRRWMRFPHGEGGYDIAAFKIVEATE